MNKKNEKVNVVFLKTRSDENYPAEILAYFPDMKWTNNGTKTCYAHNGQHGPCSERYALEDCRPATEKEYKPLLKELTGKVGYSVVILDPVAWKKSNGERLKELKQIDRDNFTLGEDSEDGETAATA